MPPFLKINDKSIHVQRIHMVSDAIRRQRNDKEMTKKRQKNLRHPSAEGFRQVYETRFELATF